MTTRTEKKVVTHVTYDLVHYEYIDTKPCPVYVIYEEETGKEFNPPVKGHTIAKNIDADTAVYEWRGDASTFPAFQKKMLADQEHEWVITDIYVTMGKRSPSFKCDDNIFFSDVYVYVEDTYSSLKNESNAEIGMFRSWRNGEYAPDFDYRGY